MIVGMHAFHTFASQIQERKNRNEIVTQQYDRDVYVIAQTDCLTGT
jgi:hypothetical protein